MPDVTPGGLRAQAGRYDEATSVNARSAAEWLRAAADEIERYDEKDRAKTREINILVPENRGLARELERRESVDTEHRAACDAFLRAVATTIGAEPFYQLAIEKADALAARVAELSDGNAILVDQLGAAEARVRDLEEARHELLRSLDPDLIERDADGTPVYVHASDCPSFCDYACNGKRGQVWIAALAATGKAGE